MDFIRDSDMSRTATTAISDISVRWPICMYSENSKRHKPNAKSTLNQTPVGKTIEWLSPLDKWDAYPEIAIDGMNGTGKSSLIAIMNRKYMKINEFIPHVTNGSRYNYDMLKSMQYLTLQPYSDCRNVCWDRCCYSNLIFYFVHQLMYAYRNKTMPIESAEVYMTLNTLAISTNLLQTLTLMENVKRTPTIFLVCRDFKLIGAALRNRDTPNDIYNAKELNYQIAQYHAYKYFGEILKFPTFDIVDAFELGLTLGEFHHLLKMKIDTNTTEFTISLPSIRGTIELDEMMDALNADETLLYDYSNK